MISVVRTHTHAKRHRTPLKNDVALFTSSLRSSPAIVRNVSLLNLPKFVSICWCEYYPRLGKRKLICLLQFTCNYVVSVRRGFLFLEVLGSGCVILLWHSLSLPYNYYKRQQRFLAFLVYRSMKTTSCTNKKSPYYDLIVNLRQ